MCFLCLFAAISGASLPIKIAILADTHLAGANLIPSRRGEIADTLLLRAVHRLNRLTKPDLVLIMGDVISENKMESIPNTTTLESSQVSPDFWR